MELSDLSVHAFIQRYKIKTERGVPLDFKDHPFLFDIYRDMSSKQVIMKAAQVGLTLLEMIKLFWVVSKKKLETIFCVDEETEILTKRGFLRYNELTLDDVALSIDLKGVAHWSSLKEIFLKPVEMDLYKLKNRNFDALVTPNHRWIVEDNGGKLKMMETEEMIGKYVYIPKRVIKAQNVTLRRPVLTDDYVRLLAWVFSEGHYIRPKVKKNFGINIAQSERVNPHRCQEIRRVLASNGIKWNESKIQASNGCRYFTFHFEPGRSIRERFPEKMPDMEFANSLTKEQARIFIETFVDGDGWRDPSGTLCITQKDEKCVDVLSAIAVYAGFVPSKMKSVGQTWFTLKFTQSDYTHVGELHFDKVPYKGIIWCPRTEYGTFYARRGGRCYWTGNTMPTDNDVSIFVGARLNSLIQQNPIFQELCKDRDTVETKRIGENTVYFKGTHTKRAAISVPADLLVHDELDASNQIVVEDYETRLQHSKHKMRWVFSHPSFENVGAHKYWLLSDQKHWFITCEHCQKKQYLSWPESICTERLAYVCKGCNEVLSDDTRRRGEWVQKYKDREWSGYWINALMCPWISAKEIVDKFNTKDPEYFYTKVLGLPYVGEGNKLNREDIMKNVSANKPIVSSLPVVIGIDTGIKLHYVVGSPRGFLEYGEAAGYEELEDLLNRYPRAIFVFDQGGDLIGPRKFRQKHRGKVYLCHYEKDRKTMQLIRWGSGDEEGNVKVDRNRMISMIVGEFQDSRLPLFGTEEYWEEFWQHAASIYRIKEENQALGTVEYRWERSGPDHFFHALLYSRVGLSRVKDQMGAVVRAPKKAARSDEVQEGIHMGPTGKSFHNLRLK